MPKEIAMIKSILVPLQGFAPDANALGAAYNIARLFDAHLDCLYVRPDPRLLVASAASGMETGLGTGVFPTELWNALVEADKERARTAHAHFEAFCKQHHIGAVPSATAGVSAAFREIEGDAARDDTLNARYSDLVVFSHDSLISDISWDAKGDVIIGCGKPILLAPTKAGLNALSTIAIAWKDTAEAARAVTASMPLLLKAKDIVVVTAREGSATPSGAQRSAQRLVELLHRHGLPARAEHVTPEPKSVGESIIDRVIALKAELLVMGAYGHGRVRELVFGGFTRHVLHETRLPVLMAH
jgi:nucleotide-binding universal stress UspA family protein